MVDQVVRMLVLGAGQAIRVLVNMAILNQQLLVFMDAAAVVVPNGGAREPGAVVMAQTEKLVQHSFTLISNKYKEAK